MKSAENTVYCLWRVAVKNFENTQIGVYIYIYIYIETKSLCIRSPCEDELEVSTVVKRMDQRLCVYASHLVWGAVIVYYLLSSGMAHHTPQTNVCTYTYTHIHIHTYTYTYIYTDIHIYIYTYTYIHIHYPM
jgi:hypothetical protein